MSATSLLIGGASREKPVRDVDDTLLRLARTTRANVYLRDRVAALELENAKLRFAFSRACARQRSASLGLDAA